MNTAARFQVDARLASLLGENYRSTEHAVKELVDNAWDADATVIEISLPEAMTLDPIVIKDNGSGMTEQELRQEYLMVANDRRSRKGDRTIMSKRLVKGRKGIGKFAGLMVAESMELETSARSMTTSVTIAKSALLTASRDLEQIDLPIAVRPCSPEHSGTTVTLRSLNSRFSFPSPEMLKSLLMTEYGREQDVKIIVNGDPLGLEDLPGAHFQKTEDIPDAGSVRLDFVVAEEGKRLKQSGIALRVGGKIVGKPHYWGLENDPEIPPKLLKKLYGEVEADSLLDSVTADWGLVVDNSKVLQKIEPVVQAYLKNALDDAYKQEMHLQRARIIRQIKLQLEKMPEYRRQFAQEALGKIMKRFYGESEEKVETVVSVVLEAFEKDEYWQVLKQIDESKGGDIEAFASSLEVFGLLDMALMATQANSRLTLLDSLEELIRNEETLEKTVHGVIENNKWILGYDYSLISSNQTLAKTIESYTSEKFIGERAKRRPDLLLASMYHDRHLLIEFKRPSKWIDRDDQNQAQIYRDELCPRFGHIEILLLGKGREQTATVDRDPPQLNIVSYESLISNARNQLTWLLRELKSKVVEDR